MSDVNQHREGYSPPSEKFKSGTSTLGQGVKAAFAETHGTGEALRGKAAAAVDRAANDPEGAIKNEATAQQGVKEMDTGHFSEETKGKEGMRALRGHADTKREGRPPEHAEYHE